MPEPTADQPYSGHIRMKPTTWTTAALVNLAVAIGLGAFGAHALKPRVSAEALEWFKTGHSYHMWVALAILVVSFLPQKGRFCAALLVGTFLFSGSLYLLAITGIRWLGAVTPLGGATWIVTLAWLALAQKGSSHATEPQDHPSP